MRRPMLCLALLAVAACGGSTDVLRTRYNFAVVDGLNQVSTAGAPVLAKPITAKLTRDPEGKFATRVFDFLAPKLAFAQDLPLSGEPIAGQLVCGRESEPGEPKVEPLCAFTLADGKAPNVVKPGTKAGVYNMVFTAQDVGVLPVKDSTTVTVEAGPMASHKFPAGFGYNCWTVFLPTNVLDQYGNPVPYGFTTTGDVAHPASTVLGTADARTLVADKDGEGTVAVYTATGTITTGKLIVTNSGACISLQF